MRTPSVETPPAEPTRSPTAHSTKTPSPTSTELRPRLEPSLTPTASSGLPNAGDPYTPTLGNSGYDTLHYHLSLSLDPAVTFLQGRTTIQATSLVHNLTRLSLDFSGFEVLTLTVDGIPAGFDRERGKLFINLPTALNLDQVFTLDIEYQGVPIQTGSPYVPFLHHLGLQFHFTSLYALNQPDGAHYWFPCNDHPSDKATFSFEIETPKPYTAVANGSLDGIEDHGIHQVFRWSHPFPMATYLVALGIGEYETIETRSPAGIPIRHYIFPDLLPAFSGPAAVTGEALDWMGELFGAYPYEEFGFITTRVIRFSIESQSRPLLSEEMLNEETVIHEIAHMWFGNWVTMESWADIWHSEGFAVYLSLMWQTRNQPEAINIFMQNLEAVVAREASSDPLGNLSSSRMLGFDSYQRGALMIHNLRLEMGDEAFFSGLGTYFDRFGGGTASRAEFIQVMEEAGGKDLDAFFSSWLD